MINKEEINKAIALLQSYSKENFDLLYETINEPDRNHLADTAEALRVLASEFNEINLTIDIAYPAKITSTAVRPMGIKREQLAYDPTTYGFAD